MNEHSHFVLEKDYFYYQWFCVKASHKLKLSLLLTTINVILLDIDNEMDNFVHCTSKNKTKWLKLKHPNRLLSNKIRRIENIFTFFEKFSIAGFVFEFWKKNLMSSVVEFVSVNSVRDGHPIHGSKKKPLIYFSCFIN